MAHPMTGRTISHYRILEKLGEGGMGVVYKAEDLKLKRTVALKFLRPEVLESEEHKIRFLHEAQAAAALNHPNICTIHEIDEADGHSFIAMEFIEGQSVREKIEERPLKLDEALDIAIQTGQGLHAAHNKDIVHRDIKSANVMVTVEGLVKIMDFGLAHLGEGTRITKTGSKLGTPAYMSPEQVRGEVADHRADIWSFGVVLYEMVSGQLPFKGEVEAAVSHGILDEEPEPLTALRAGLPLQLDRIVSKALAKSADERYPHADDMLVDLRVLKQRHVGAGLARPERPPRRKWAVTAAVLAAVLIFGAGAWFGLRGPTTRTSEAALTPVPLTTYPGTELSPSFSPDGNEVAFAWDGEDESNFDIYRKLIGPGAPLRLTSHPARDDWPAWSPDGQHIAFLRDIGAGKAGIFLIPSLPGVERQVGEKDASVFWNRDRLAWSPDAKWLVVSDRAAGEQPISLFLLSVASHQKRRITFPSETSEADHGASVPPQLEMEKAIPR